MRYAYMVPAGLRGGRAIPVTPFESVWHLHLGRFTADIAAKWSGPLSRGSRCTLFRSRGALMAHGTTKQIARTEGRPNPKARRRARKKILAQRAQSPR